MVALNNESTLSNKQTQMFMQYTKNVLTSGYQIIEKELQKSENDKNVFSSLSNLINSFWSALNDLDTEKKQLKIFENSGQRFCRE